MERYPRPELAAPFLGSKIRDLPLLDEVFVSFVSFVVDLVEEERKDLRPVDGDALKLAFRDLGHRPQLLDTVIQEELSPLSGAEGRFEGRVPERAGRWQAELEVRPRRVRDRRRIDGPLARKPRRSRAMAARSHLGRSVERSLTIRRRGVTGACHQARVKRSRRSTADRSRG